MEIWIEERCDKDSAAAVQSSNLFADWKVWSELRGEKAGHQRTFNDKMGKHGFKLGPHTRTGKIFIGVKLKSDVLSDSDRKDEEYRKQGGSWRF